MGLGVEGPRVQDFKAASFGFPGVASLGKSGLGLSPEWGGAAELQSTY